MTDLIDPLCAHLTQLRAYPDWLIPDDPQALRALAIQLADDVTSAELQHLLSRPAGTGLMCALLLAGHVGRHTLHAGGQVFAGVWAVQAADLPDTVTAFDLIGSDGQVKLTVPFIRHVSSVSA